VIGERAPDGFSSICHWLALIGPPGIEGINHPAFNARAQLLAIDRRPTTSRFFRLTN